MGYSNFILFISSIAIIAVYHLIVNKLYFKHYTKINEESAKFYSFLTETFDNLLSIICFNFQKKRLYSYNKQIETIGKESFKLTAKKNVVDVLALDVPLTAISLSIFIYSLYKIFHGEFNVGRYFAIASYYGMIRGPLESLKYLAETIASTGIHAKRLLDFINLTGQEKTSTEYLNTDIIWEVKNLKKIYDDKIVIDDISFEIQKNDIVGLSLIHI